MAVSIDKQTFTLQFQKKVTLELAVLNQKLSHQLRHEITQAFEQSLFTDLEVSIGGSGVGVALIRAHSCVVQSRAPKFYSKVCANRHKVVLPDKADRRSIEAFFRTLYWCNDVNQEENDILKQLKRLYQQQQQQQVATPESDVYLTPQASPSGGEFGGNQQRFSNSFVLDDSTSSHLDQQQHKKNAALYYSLVPIDEVFDSDCSTSGGVLEKELAEQDQLFKSFKSILNKEQRTRRPSTTNKRTKPTSLSLTSSHNPKQANSYDSLHKNLDKNPTSNYVDSVQRNSSSNLDSLQKNSAGISVDSVQKNSTNNRDSVQKNSINNLDSEQKISASISLDSEQKISPKINVDSLQKSVNSKKQFAVDLKRIGRKGSEEEEEVRNSSKNVQDVEELSMNKVAKVVESGAGVKECDDAMSNPETEVLDAASSGYVTGSSPREHTVSMSEEATFGNVDVTEAASSEDLMPHDDNDVRGRRRGGGESSSSVSSDGGTWDSTFPPTAANLPDLVQIENNHNTQVDLFEPVRNGIRTPVEPPTNPEQYLKSVNVEELGFSNSLSKSPENKFSDSNTRNKGGESNVEDMTSDVVNRLPDKLDSKSHSKNRASEQIDSNVGEVFSNVLDGVCRPPDHSNLSENKGSEQVERKVEETSCDLLNSSCKSSEKSGDSHCAASKNNFFIDASSLLDESELANLQVTSNNSGTYTCQNDICCDVMGGDCNEEVKVGNKNGVGVNGCDKKSAVSPNGEMTFEERRSSLIRRNTFELDPDDGKKLVKLQQEFEKSKDVENGCTKNEFEPENCGSDVKKPLKSPNSLLIVAKSLPTQRQDDDMHSPDSLNNDAPLEVMFEDRNEEEKRRILGKANKDKINNHDGSEYDSKLYNSGLFFNVENTLDQCFKYDSNRLHCDKDDSSVNENGGSSRMSDCSSTLSRSSDRLNRIECMPIVSGGASISDFSPPVSCASPLARRKTEMAPILSGGSVLMPENDEKIVQKPKTNNAFTASWIVDMSDTVKSPEMRKKTRSDSARSSGSSEEHDDLSKSDAAKSPPIMKTSNLGFFIPLDDPKTDKPGKQPPKLERQDSKSGSQNSINQSCGFFIDLTANVDKPKEKAAEKSTNVMPADKKLFSMFIDISETSSTENVSPKSKTSSPNLFANKKLKPKTITSRFHTKHDDLRSSDSQLSSESSIEMTVEHPEVARGKHLFGDQLNCTPPPSRQISTNENSTVDLSSTSSQHESRKKGFFMFIEAENSSPVPRRRTLPSGLRPNSQRHSWNLDSSKNGGGVVVNQEVKKEHKRAHSVSVDRTLATSFTIANCDAEKKSSSVTSLVKNNKEFNSVLLDSGPASIDEATMQRDSRAMISSWHGPVKPSSELQKVLARKELRESKTMLGLSSKLGEGNNSETSLSCDETYDLRTDSVVSDLSDSCKGGNNSTFIVGDVSNVANAATSNMDLSTPSHEMAASELSNDSEPVVEKLQTVKEESSKSFVKLSDMDKDPPPVKLATQRKSYDAPQHRMSRSIPEAGSWLENRLMTRSATSRSLGRLFPHLQVRSPTSDDFNAANTTDVSEMSSMQSSMEPSLLEGSTTTDDGGGSVGAGAGGGACSRLGEDLLRMFVEEISCDVVVEVGGRRLRAHKCILASRCQYFAAMLSGGWVESAGNVISLQGFSYNAVHFALCHIYSGTSNIPDSINIVELATLADMLCLEGLKEVIMYTLKVKYCHFFHKPCALCTVGVLECLPLAAAYGLDEIYRKSLRWICKHFVRVWPTKGFATLPRELIDKCLKQHVVHMSVENVLDTVMSCEKLEATIPQVRWADPVFSVTQRLHETAVKFITQHFSGVLASEMFLSLGKDSTWNLERVKKTLLSAVDKGLSPDQACRSLARLTTLLAVADSHSPSSPTSPPPEISWSPEFVRVLRDVRAACESSVVKQASRAVRSAGWLQLDGALRQRIQQAACLVVVPGDERRRARLHHSLHKRSEDRSSSCSSSSGLRSSDLHQVKVVMSQQNVGSRKPLAEAPAAATKTLSNRASVPQANSQRASARHAADENAAAKTKSWPHRLAEVKSRYLEQRAPLKTTTVPSNKPAAGPPPGAKCWSVPAQRKGVAGAKGGNKAGGVISSSDSSRTSSPAMRTRSIGARMQPLHQRKPSETLSMSTDSLVEAAAAGKQVKSEPVEVNGNIRTRTTKKTVAAAAAVASKTKSAESLLSARNGPKLINNNKGSSPVPLTKRTPTSQTSPRVLTRASPKISTTAASPRASATKPPTTTNNVVKRNATYRVTQQTASKAPLSPPPPANNKMAANKTKLNNSNNNNSQQQRKIVNNNCSSSPLLNRVKQMQQPGVGSRSGTFLKDEPTVLAKQTTAAAEGGQQ
ncbi:hypothetical protein LSTR_LSTR003870 [Laodelphax striatellus]|uniref:BTB domain-containing protein n=1 Tax=Laodelphax striatellus TaxID=195883 RepID=A0A482XF76_LAOST|nr:hypothetical protein LSTR_LSTR003870 [Laodelphax striatellus]